MTLTNVTWETVGANAAFRGTRTMTVFDTDMYSTEASGLLYKTSLKTGIYQTVGDRQFANTAHLMTDDRILVCIEDNGDLFRVDPLSGHFQRVGNSGAWKGTVAACVTKGSLFSVDGAILYRTDLNDGTFKAVSSSFGGTRTLFLCNGRMLSLDRAGRLFRVRRTGEWRPLADDPNWRGVLGITALHHTIFTIDGSGRLHTTDPKTGAMASIGEADYRDTRFLFNDGNNLFTIEKSGSMYRLALS